MATFATEQPIITPNQDDIAAARLAREQLGKLSLSFDRSNYQLVINGQESEIVQIPSSAMHLFVQLLSEIADGHAVTVTSVHEELSTQKAADILNVSRPYLIQLLEQGKIPFHKVGTHRRVRLADILSYKEQIDAQRLNTLDELAAQAQELDMGY
jgi:excisionase family DNA binding protein